jgi:hypothetical protein
MFGFYECYVRSVATKVSRNQYTLAGTSLRTRHVILEFWTPFSWFGKWHILIGQDVKMIKQILIFLDF